MPKALERKLEKQASAEGLKGARKDAYVYGTMRKTGWKPEREKKHDASMTSKALRGGKG
jgi:hypothetical protein